jgi:hypothetical protein
MERTMTPYPVIEFWIKVLTFVGVVAALLLTWLTHMERADFEMIDRLYALCYTLEAHVLKNWFLAHLFCIGVEEYQLLKKRIIEKLTDPSLYSEYIVKEKLFAIHIILIYEQVYYQWVHTSKLHWRRKKFLGEILSYFSDRLLQNPRLRYFITEDLTGRALHLEQESKKYIDGRIKEYMNNANEHEIDKEGPFSQIKQESVHVAHVGAVNWDNLTGRWTGNDGGTYFIKQTGNQIWWLGQSADNGAAFANVFNGTLLGNLLIGRWSDVPRGQSQNAGELSIQIVDANHLQTVVKTGSFGASEWTRSP